MPRLKHALLAVALISALGLFAAACADDGDTDAESSSTASQAAIDDLSARVQRNEMMFAVITLGGLHIHDMDETLNTDGTIESSFAPNTRTAVRVLALTNWDASLKADAEEVHGHAVALLEALEAEDVEAAKTAARELHETSHDFGDAVWDLVAKDLPADAGGPEADHDEGATTPAAGTTPEAEETP